MNCNNVFTIITALYNSQDSRIGMGPSDTDFGILLEFIT